MRVKRINRREAKVLELRETDSHVKVQISEDEVMLQQHGDSIAYRPCRQRRQLGAAEKNNYPIWLVF